MCHELGEIHIIVAIKAAFAAEVPALEAAVHLILISLPAKNDLPVPWRLQPPKHQRMYPQAPILVLGQHDRGAARPRQEDFGAGRFLSVWKGPAVCAGGLCVSGPGGS